MHLRMGMRVGKLSATSRLPAYCTTWQLFLRTVPKLLLFLPSIVNMLPISPDENAFPQASPRPTQHFCSTLSRPHMSLPPGFHTPRPCTPGAASTRPKPRAPDASTRPGPWHPHPRLAPVLPPRGVPPWPVCCDIWLFRPYFTPNSPKTQHTERRRRQTAGGKRMRHQQQVRE